MTPHAHGQTLIDIQLDERTVVRRRPEVEHERAVAIYDLLEENYFAPVGDFVGPYSLHLSLEENRLLFDVRTRDDQPLCKIQLPLKPFQSLVKDYFMVCETYYTAIKKASPSKIEAIDMGGAACTTRARSCCANGWPARSTSTSTPRAASSR